LSRFSILADNVHFSFCLRRDATVVEVLRVPKLKVKTDWYEGIPQHGADSYMALEGHQDFSETIASNEQRNPKRNIRGKRDDSDASQAPIYEPPSM
jgi:hypothetical protein